MIPPITAEMAITGFLVFLVIVSIHYTKSLLLGVFPILAFLIYFSMEGYVYSFLWYVIILMGSGVFVFFVIVPMFKES